MAGKAVLVMGAGASTDGWTNGAAAAVLYAREGARVAVVDVSPEAGARTLALIEGDAVAFTADVTHSAEVAAAVAGTVGAFGRVDVLHNNVGAIVMGGPESLSEEGWHRALDLNLTGAFVACKHVLPVMLAQESGVVVNISSIAAVRAVYAYPAYAAAKAGLNQLTRSMAVQYARQGIRVNAVMPGLMDTPLIRRDLAGQHGDIVAMAAARHAASPTGRMGDAWDVAYAALFLASDEARYVNGVCLAVDGGLTCT